jgi:hypothetical protein
MRLRVEVEGSAQAIELPGEGAELVALMSFAVSRGFGATHPMIALADRLYERHRVRWGPLTTFYEAEAEDAEDTEKLEMAWQGAGPLREELVKLAHAIEADEQARTLARRAGAESVPEQARALAEALAAAISESRRVRLVYDL